ncbi:hypothetical protein KA005_32900 [bacterium]|nr:hypothetical protein [bacterium]
MRTVDLDVKVEFSAFDEKTGRVLVKQLRKEGKQHFKVRIFLRGPDLHKVKKVIYTLHPTFPRPRREVRTGPHFELVIWTWGIFNLSVDIYDKGGNVDHREIFLDYSQDINNAKAKNLLFWAK